MMTTVWTTEQNPTTTSSSAAQLYVIVGCCQAGFMMLGSGSAPVPQHTASSPNILPTAVDGAIPEGKFSEPAEGAVLSSTDLYVEYSFENAASGFSHKVLLHEQGTNYAERLDSEMRHTFGTLIQTGSVQRGRSYYLTAEVFDSNGKKVSTSEPRSFSVAN
jgi:hypothetical protein